jgi:hypothetical protein
MRNKTDHLTGMFQNPASRKRTRPPFFGAISYFLVEETLLGNALCAAGTLIQQSHELRAGSRRRQMAWRCPHFDTTSKFFGIGARYVSEMDALRCLAMTAVVAQHNCCLSAGLECGSSTLFPALQLRLRCSHPIARPIQSRFSYAIFMSGGVFASGRSILFS